MPRSNSSHHQGQERQSRNANPGYVYGTPYVPPLTYPVPYAHPASASYLPPPAPPYYPGPFAGSVHPVYYGALGVPIYSAPVYLPSAPQQPAYSMPVPPPELHVHTHYHEESPQHHHSEDHRSRDHASSRKRKYDEVDHSHSDERKSKKSKTEKKPHSISSQTELYDEIKDYLREGIAKIHSNQKKFARYNARGIKLNKKLTQKIETNRLDLKEATRLIYEAGPDAMTVAICNQLIKFFGKDHLKLSSWIFQKINESELANERSYNIILDQLIKNNEFQLFKKLYQEMNEKNTLDEIGLLTAHAGAAKFQDWEMQKAIFSQMQKRGCVDNISVNIFIKNCFLNGEIMLAEQIFQNQYENKLITRAIDIQEEINPYMPNLLKDRAAKKIDFHAFDFGTSWILLHMLANSKELCFLLVIGKNTHSRECENPPVRAAYNAFTEKYSTLSEMRFFPWPGNSGRVILEKDRRLNLPVSGEEVVKYELSLQQQRKETLRRSGS